MKKLRIIKVIHAEKSEQGKWTREYVNTNYCQATLYQIEKRDIIEIRYKGSFVKYLMKRTQYEKEIGT